MPFDFRLRHLKIYSLAVWLRQANADVVRIILDMKFREISDLHFVFK